MSEPTEPTIKSVKKSLSGGTANMVYKSKEYNAFINKRWYEANKEKYKFEAKLNYYKKFVSPIEIDIICELHKDNKEAIIRNLKIAKLEAEFNNS